MERIDVFGAIPDEIGFDIKLEPAERNGYKVPGQNWVVRTDTDRPLYKTVGDVFNTVSHKARFSGIQDVMIEHMPSESLEDVRVSYSTARFGEWALMDVTFNKVRMPVETLKHMTDVGMRIIAWSGIAGSSSNNILFGAIDFFCTNGMIRGDHDLIRKRNSTNFTLEGLLKELRESKDGFTNFVNNLQRWARTPINYSIAMSAIENVIDAERKQQLMMELYADEVVTRGHNLYSLYSAFTNYASHENIGAMRNTGHDTKKLSMWRREQEVAGWVNQPLFN